MVRRQALGWLGAAVCSVALVITGGLVLSSVAVHRYLQASASQLHRGDSPDAGATAVPGEVANVQRTVSALTAMPGVETASSTVATSSSPRTISYDVAITMAADATAVEGADVVYAMTQELQNGRVNLELTLPANAEHAASVIEYRSAFDTPVARSTVESVSHAVDIAASVPGVKSVHVTVPYTWNLASGSLDVEMATGDSHQSAALKHALSRTALAGVAWSTPQVSPGASPAAPNRPTTSSPASSSQRPGVAATPEPSASPTSTPSPTPTDLAAPPSTPHPSATSPVPEATDSPGAPVSSHGHR